MKNGIKCTALFLMAVLFVLGVYNVASIFNLKMLEGDIKYEVIYRNAKNVIAIDCDDSGNIFIAKSTMIKHITPEGKEETVLSSGDYDIEDILKEDNKVYFVSKDSLYMVDITTKKVEKYNKKIPSCYENSKRKLFKINGNIGLMVPSFTNAGISEGMQYDLPAIDFILNGNNFGIDCDTSYCKKAHEKASVGEKIKAKEIGNAAIYIVNKKTGDFSLYASGIRAVSGIDTDEDSKVYGIFVGIENKGIRSVIDDRDYIYEIKKDKFYGFPDYSGGDYIESSRFQNEDNETIKGLLLNDYNFLDKDIKPIIISKKQGSLNSIAIDKKGTVFNKNSMIFYDDYFHCINVINESGYIEKKINVSDKSYISDIVYGDEDFYILDSTLGCIYKITSANDSKAVKVPVALWIFITLLSLVILILIIYKGIKKKSKK